MQRRDLIIGAVVLVIITAIVLFVQRRRQEVALPTPSPISTPTIEEQEQEIESRFRIEIPEDVEKANLTDARGGSFSGLATRNFENGVFDLTVLADLPDPEANEFYQVWVRSNGDTRKLGTMSIAKGGYLLDITLREDLTAFDEIVVSLEAKNDSQIETTVLQGSF